MIGKRIAWTAAVCLLSACAVAAQDASSRAAYLSWTSAEAERIGKATRVNGRVGGALDFRVVHTERSYNYKLRATWLSKDVVEATARLLQLSEHLSDSETAGLVGEAVDAGDIVLMIEVDPREGSGVIPNDWSAYLGPAEDDRRRVKGVNTPALETRRALRGVYRRDYNYERFWLVFPKTASDGAALLPNGVGQAELTVRIASKEGRVLFPLPRR